MAGYAEDIEPQWHPAPVIHLKAPRGWLNDPCAPGYDTTTGTYHLFYQWNPESCDWGDISWGHFTSRDGVRWQHNGSEPVLTPSQPYDKDGVFTGCLYTTGPRGEEDQLTIIYSSACHLPISWKLPYQRNCVGLSMAVSHDGGNTWNKSSENPILSGEPDGVEVWGFRDPFLSGWPALDQLRGHKSLYGLVSGGIQSMGPRVFLYAVSPVDLGTWRYLGPLIDFPIRYSPSLKWGADFGANLECANVMTLKHGSEERSFLLAGSEGALMRGVTPKNDVELTGCCFWMAGTLREEQGETRMAYEYSGLLDNGCFYAPSSYDHPVTHERIVWGWLKEEDVTLERRQEKGWTGYLSLPRSLFLLRIPNVSGTLTSPLAAAESFKIVDSARDGTQTVETLGIKPLPALKTLRRNPPAQWSNIVYSGARSATPLTQSTAWELKAVISVPKTRKCVGFHIQHSRDLSHRTTIYFCPTSEEIVVDRSKSNTEDDIKKDTLVGPFTLLTYPNEGVVATEKLRLQIFSDGNVVEIFANDRFALSTLIYTDLNCNNYISCFVDGDGSEEIVFHIINIWEDLSSVFL